MLIIFLSALVFVKSFEYGRNDKPLEGKKVKK